MIEMFDLKTLVTLASQVGFPAVVLLIWYQSDKSHQRTLEVYREDMLRMQGDNKLRIEEVREMYERNVELVKVTQQYTGDYRDVLLMVCQGLQGIRDDVKTNQYCPNVRLKKTAEGFQG
jgi:hypothetical protein